MNKKLTLRIVCLICACLLSACGPTTNKNMARLARKTDINEVMAHYNPEAAKINVQLGMGYLQQGSMQQAKRKLLMALQQAPDSAVANDAMAYYQELTGNMKRANYFYVHAINLAPGRGAQLNNYGGFLCRQGNYARADEYFMAAVRDTAYVNSVEAYENAGLCAVLVPNLAKAQKYLQQTLQQDPRRLGALYELAHITYKLRDYKAAEKYLQRYRQVSQKKDAASTLLMYQVAKKLSRSIQAAGFATILKKQFADSKQYRQLFQMQRHIG